MKQLPKGGRVVLASNNQGKVREINHLLEGLHLEVLPQGQFDIPEAEETGLSFVENAILKARNAARYSGLPAIADDSGLEVDALNGSPGIYSARFAGPGCSDSDNNARLLQELQGLPADQRTARFQCVMVFLRHAEDPTPIICQGTWEGSILEQEQGNNGFGYDPLFLVGGRDCSSAQLEPEEKNRLSHRGQALRALLERLVTD